MRLEGRGQLSQGQKMENLTGLSLDSREGEFKEGHDLKYLGFRKMTPAAVWREGWGRAVGRGCSGDSGE